MINMDSYNKINLKDELPNPNTTKVQVEVSKNNNNNNKPILLNRFL